MFTCAFRLVRHPPSHVAAALRDDEFRAGPPSSYQGAVAHGSPICEYGCSPTGGVRMTDRQPSEVTNLDRYGDPVLPWSRAHDVLASGPKGPGVGFFLGTVRPNRRPHAAGI